MEREQEKMTTGEERSWENPEEERAAETRNRNKTSADGNANRQLREEEKPQGRPARVEGNLHNEEKEGEKSEQMRKDTKRSGQEAKP